MQDPQPNGSRALQKDSACGRVNPALHWVEIRRARRRRGRPHRDAAAGNDRRVGNALAKAVPAMLGEERVTPWGLIVLKHVALNSKAPTSQSQSGSVSSERKRLTVASPRGFEPLLPP